MSQREDGPNFDSQVVMRTEKAKLVPHILHQDVSLLPVMVRYKFKPNKPADRMMGCRGIQVRFREMPKDERQGNFTILEQNRENCIRNSTDMSSDMTLGDMRFEIHARSMFLCPNILRA